MTLPAAPLAAHRDIAVGDRRLSGWVWVAAISVAFSSACATAPRAASPQASQGFVKTTPAVATTPPAAAPPEPPRFSEGVLARFPEPAVRYSGAPGLQDGRSDFTTASELQAFLRGLSRTARWGTRSSVVELGRSQEGQPIEAVLLTRQPDDSPAALLRGSAPTVALIGQQHGDEPASAEALLVLADQLARGPLNALLEHINVIVLPRANPDGAARQQAATANGIDAQRDHLLLRSPEAQAQARLMREYQPLVVADAHEYPAVQPFLDRFGALPRHDVLTQYAMTAQMHPFVTRAAEEWFRQPLVAELKKQGLSVEWSHRPVVDAADKSDKPEKRLAMGGPQPDLSRNTHGLRHAVSLVVETRGVGLGRLHLQRRVHAQVTAMTEVLKQAADRAADLRKLRQYVDADVSARACQGQVVIEALATPTEYTLKTLDPPSGAERDMVVNWDSTLQLNERRKRARPCGYWLAASQTEAATQLSALGLQVQQVSEVGVVQGVARAAAGASAPVAPSRSRTVVDAPVGSFYVPLSQPLAHLAVAALEPDTPFSYAANGLLAVDQYTRVLAVPSLKTSPLP